MVAVTPVQTATGCWALVTRLTASESLARPVSTPYWQRPDVVLAFGLYLSLASVILLVLLSVSRNLVRFERLARSISVGQIGRAACRERVCQYVYISVVAVSLNTKEYP